MTNTETASRWRLNGRRALVTGGTKGIGAAIVHELLGLGATVTLVARNESEVQARVSELRAAGLDAHGTQADLSTNNGRETALSYAATQMGGLDILVNNVGTNVRKPSLDITPDEYERVFGTNLTGMWEACRAAYPYLSEAARETGDAVIINIGSVAGNRSVGSGGPYAISKAAVDQLTRYLAVEWARVPVRVNAVNPWYTRTPLASPVLENPDFVARVLSFTPNKRVAEPEDISGLAAFLCLPAARHITGQTVAVDGGYSARGFNFTGE